MIARRLQAAFLTTKGKTHQSFQRNEMTHLFIVTYGRSGSTLLQSLLNSMAGVLIRGENQMALLPLIESWNRLCVALEKHGNQQRKQDHPWYGINDVDPDSYGRAMADLFVREVLKVEPGYSIIGFKEIGYNGLTEQQFDRFLDFSMRYFSNAKFIFNTRSAADVSQSAWYRRRPKNTVMEEISVANSRFEKYQKKYLGHSLLVRYEDVIKNQEELERIANFLGAKMDPASIEKVFTKKLTH